jgi:type IV secretory pathway TrbL component
MQSPLVQFIIVCALAIAGWWISDRFAPDQLLNQLVKLLIFIGVLIWVIVKIVPKI